MLKRFGFAEWLAVFLTAIALVVALLAETPSVKVLAALVCAAIAVYAAARIYRLHAAGEPSQVIESPRIIAEMDIPNVWKARSDDRLDVPIKLRNIGKADAVKIRISQFAITNPEWRNDTWCEFPNPIPNLRPNVDTDVTPRIREREPNGSEILETPTFASTLISASMLKGTAGSQSRTWPLRIEYEDYRGGGYFVTCEIRLDADGIAKRLWIDCRAEHHGVYRNPTL